MSPILTFTVWSSRVIRTRNGPSELTECTFSKVQSLRSLNKTSPFTSSTFQRFCFVLFYFGVWVGIIL